LIAKFFILYFQSSDPPEIISVRKAIYIDK